MIIHLDEVDSTNEYLKRMVADNSVTDDVTVVTAKYQTAGKGRRGRQWITKPGETLMFSILIKPQIDMSRCSMLTLVMAMTVRSALADVGADTVIKWPNDIVHEGRKLCGILTEALVESGHIIIGVGINTNQQTWPEDLADKTTSVCCVTGSIVDHQRLMDRIIYYFNMYLNIFVEDGNLSSLKDNYESVLVNMNNTVTVLDPNGEYTGICQGIDEEGQLLVECDGEIRKVYAGEVSVRGVYGYV